MRSNIITDVSEEILFDANSYQEISIAVYEEADVSLGIFQLVPLNPKL